MPRPDTGHQRLGDPRTAAVVEHFEVLSLATLEALMQLYADDARFKDPFNAVQGQAAIRSIFTHMFHALIEPHFQVLEAVTQGDQAFLSWDFSFRRRGSALPMTIHGATHLSYDSAGRIALHRDYWDAAEELYAKLPLLGVLMRWLAKQMRTPERRANTAAGPRATR